MTEAKPKILVAAPLPADLAARLAEAADVWEASFQEVARAVEEKDPRLGEIEGVLGTIFVKMDEAFFAQTPKLKVASNFAVGFDNITVPAATKRGILVCNTPGVLDNAVADLTIAMLLGLARGIAANDQFVRTGAWAKGPAPLTHDLRGRTLGLLGMGRIGRVVAKTAQAFDLKVIYHKPSRDSALEAEGIASYVERDELFRQADFLSVHCPANEATRRSIGTREFALMKPSALFINTARGAIVDEAALVQALKDGSIAGAALDVMEVEPIDAAHPLCQLPNVLLQPHVGSATEETRRAMIDLAVQNLLDALAGRQPAAVVNRELLAAAQ